MEGALFFYDKDTLIKEEIPEKPIGILFLTSLRDIALEEYNGQTLNIKGKDYYISGIIEKTLEETQKGGHLHGLVEVKGVIVDDTILDLKGKFPLLPLNNDKWIFPLDLLPKDYIWNIPSLFRYLPKNDLIGRKKAKYHFENLIFKKAQEIGADIIISDSYMAIIEFLISDFGMYGKVLNIHPGPTLINKPFCFRGNDPIKDAIFFAKSNNSPVYTGATLHFVNNKIDDGKCVAYICNTPVHDEDDEIILMIENYQKAKLPIFVAGLRHYILKIFPIIIKKSHY